MKLKYGRENEDRLTDKHTNTKYTNILSASIFHTVNSMDSKQDNMDEAPTATTHIPSLMLEEKP